MFDSCFKTSAVCCRVAGVVSVRDVLATVSPCKVTATVVVTGVRAVDLVRVGLGVLDGFVLNFSAAILKADGLRFKSTERFFFGGLGGSSEVTSNCE